MRTATAAQLAALAATDRSTFTRVWFADADGVYQNVCNLLGEDFFDAVTIDVNTDQPIGSATFTLKRKSGQHSLVPLDEDSLVNRDNTGTYAPFLNPYRYVRVEVATLATDAGPPTESDWVYLWQGITDEVDWGGESNIRVRARDPMARLNDTFIETTTSYGADDGSELLEEVIQAILTANITAPSVTLTYSATSFAVRAYQLGNVTVLEALQELVNQIGWNLSWKWNSATSTLALTLWEPARTNTTAAYTFGTDDYFMIPRTSLNLEGIRNAGEVVYVDANGTHSTASDARTDSIALYGRRFIRIDARGTSVVTSTQADTLLSNVLDDLEEPNVQQEVNCAFFWPCELGDVYAFTPNDHYSSTQTYAVFGYRHILSGQQTRTYLTVAGKPSGGYTRWHNGETVWVNRIETPTYTPGEVIHTNVSTRTHTGDTATTTLQTVTIPAIYQSFYPNGATQHAVRVTALFGTTGSGGTKDVAISYGSGGGSYLVTIPTGTQTQKIEITIKPSGSNTAVMTYDFPSNTSFTGTITSPFAVNKSQDITFTVDLADAADTATLQMSHVVWLGPSAV